MAYSERHPDIPTYVLMVVNVSNMKKDTLPPLRKSSGKIYNGFDFDLCTNLSRWWKETCCSRREGATGSNVIQKNADAQITPDDGKNVEGNWGFLGKNNSCLELSFEKKEFLNLVNTNYSWIWQILCTKVKKRFRKDIRWFKNAESSS